MDSAERSALPEVFVGRQPIYGRRLDLYAYELLYRGADVETADFDEGDRATSQVLLNTFTEFGLERVVGAHLAFVNLTRGFVTGEYPLPLPKDRVVLEVLEDVEPDPAVLDGIRALRRLGFRVALDDFVYREEMRPLLELADIVKVDVLDLEPDEVARRARLLRPYRCELLAEKVETRELFQVCLDAGYELFQGYFLARPNVVQGTSIGTARLNLLRLLASLQSEQCTLEDVERVVATDVTLSCKLLRHTGAAVHGTPRETASVRQGVARLGLATVRNLACLFLLSTLDDKPHELMVTSMMRARFCQRLAQEAGRVDHQRFFAAGLLSVLDALLDLPMERVLAQLPLDEELGAALRARVGVVGSALDCACAYEHGDWTAVRFEGLGRADIRAAFLDAVGWVEEVDQDLSGLAA